MSVVEFLLERVETPLGQMLLVTDEQGRLRALVGTIMKTACAC